MASRASRLGRTIFIVPAAHYRIFDRRLQLDLYELFHRRAACRIGHMVCTPLILLGAFLGAHRAGAAPVDPAAILAGAVLAGALLVDRWVALSMILPVGIVYAAATALETALGPASTVTAVALVAGGTYLQTISHAFEDVPPPTSGARGWVPPLVWLRTAGPARIAGAAILSLLFFPLLELWAAFRIWPLQTLHVLMRLGYRPDLRASVNLRISEILADPDRVLYDDDLAGTPWPAAEAAR